MSTTPNKETWAATILRIAKERAATEEGKKELHPFSVDQFLDVLERLTNAIDGIPENYSIHSLYLALNFVGSAVVRTMEANREQLMKQTGGSA